MKFIVGVLLGIAWAAIVVLKLAEVGPLVDFIKYTLVGLAAHMLTAAPAPAQDPAAVAPPALKVGPGQPQAGFALLPFAVLLAFAAMVLACTGCTSLTQAGNTAYSFDPVLDAAGKVAGYKFSATDGKEYAGRNISVVKSGDTIAVQVQEGASTAFQGQAIAGKALSVLPSFAPIVLPASIVPAAK
jgi:hypothetical protein